MSVMIKALVKLIKTDQRDIYIQTEKFKGEPISALHYKVREEQPKIFKQPSSIYLVTLHELLNNRYP